MSETTKRIDSTSLSKEQKLVLEELVDFISNRNGIPTNFLIEEIKSKFGLKDIPQLKVTQSLWYNATKDTNIDTTYQGFTEKTDSEGNVYRSPYLSISADMEEIDVWLRSIMK